MFLEKTMAHVAKYQKSALGRMVGHYERSAEKHGYERDNIDNSRIGEDYNLAPKDVDPVQWIQGRIETLRKQPRKNSVMMCDCVITAPAEVSDDELRRFFKAEDAALAKAFGKENCIGAWVHMDEPGARPHMHWAWVPVTQDGRLSARDVVSRTALKALHPALQKAADEALGHHVQILLDDGRKAEKYVGLDEYKKATGEARKAAERASEATKAADMAERAQKAAEARKTAAEASQVHEESKLRGLQESVAKKQAQAGDLNSEIAKKMDEKAELQADISRFSEKRDRAEAEATRSRNDAAAAKADAEGWQAIVKDVQGISYTDAEGHERMGIAGMEKAYIESQERMKAAKEQEKAYVAQASQAKADAKEWQIRAARAQRAAEVTPDSLRMALSVMVVNIAEACIMAYDMAREIARDVWHIWLDWHMPTIAQDLGIDAEEGRKISEDVLIETCEYNQCEEVADYLLEDGQEHNEQDFYPER